MIADNYDSGSRQEQEKLSTPPDLAGNQGLRHRGDGGDASPHF